MQVFFPKMASVTAKNTMFLTSILQKYKLRNVHCIFYNSLYRIHTNNKKLTTVDILDDFTIQLVKEKALKWSAKNHTCKDKQDMQTSTYTNPWKIDLRAKLKNISEYDKLKIDTSNLSIQQIDSMILSALDSDAFYDVDYLICQCLHNDQCPSVEIISEVLSVYSFKGNLKMVKSLQIFYQTFKPELSLANSHFNHYLAKAYWMKGNVKKGFEIFMDVYDKNAMMRWHVKNMMKYLIKETVSSQSEASVVILKEYSMKFGNTWNDWCLMSYFWESCWLSEWFGDQQLAETLFKECDPLRDFLHDHLFTISLNALKDHQEDAILRLLQMILGFEMKQCYKMVIGALLDYRLKQRDFRGCIEIMQNCIALKIKLTAVQDERFLNLLIANGLKCPPTVMKTIYNNKTVPYKF